MVNAARDLAFFSSLQILFAVIRSEFRRMGFRIDPRNRRDDGSRSIRVRGSRSAKREKVTGSLIIYVPRPEDPFSI